jgi:hypothetical protein
VQHSLCYLVTACAACKDSSCDRNYRHEHNKRQRQVLQRKTLHFARKTLKRSKSENPCFAQHNSLQLASKFSVVASEPALLLAG